MAGVVGAVEAPEVVGAEEVPGAVEAPEVVGAEEVPGAELDGAGRLGSERPQALTSAATAIPLKASPVSLKKTRRVITSLFLL